MRFAPRTIAQQLAWVARSISVVDTSQTTETARVLSGSGRSGTTWLMELYCRSGSLRPVFEPFHPAHEPSVTEFARASGFSRGPLPQQGASTVEAVLNGAYRAPWADRMVPTRPRNRYTQGRLIKDIRILPWFGRILRDYPGLHVVHVVRHPHGACASQLELGWPHKNLQAILKRDGVEARLPSSARSLASTDLDPWESTVMAWALENWIAASTFPKRQTTVISYDRALQDKSEIDRGATALSVPPPDESWLKEPSRMSRSSGGRRNKPKPGRSIAPGHAYASRVLAAFELDDVFCNNGDVDAEALQAWWANQKERA